MVGSGEPMDAALRLALDRHGLFVEHCSLKDADTAMAMTAPDLVLLVGDAARDGGRGVLGDLARSASNASVPVALLVDGGALDKRVLAFRHGAVAAVPRTPSADQIAQRVAQLAKELSDQGEVASAELGEATFDELVDLVTRELRSGILSVGRQGGGDAMRIVLGAGRPVAEAVEEFVKRLRPLVSRAEPLVYEFQKDVAGGAVSLVELEGNRAKDLSVFQGLRVLLADNDPVRADGLSQELRARGALVAVTDGSGRGLERARGLDPEVVVLDAAQMDGPGFDLVRQLRRDIRLRWASILVVPWDDLWPEQRGAPDVERLAEQIAPFVLHDRALRERAANEDGFDMRLEATGPCRLVRVLAGLPGPFHVIVRGARAVVSLDIAEGLVVGAFAERFDGAPFEGAKALAAMLATASARVRIERRLNPAYANVMAPVDEALSAASAEESPISPSVAPPALDGATEPPRAPRSNSSAPGRRRPFPDASEIAREHGGAMASSELEHVPSNHGAPLAPSADAARPSGGRKGGARDLRWSDSASELTAPRIDVTRPLDAVVTTRAADSLTLDDPGERPSTTAPVPLTKPRKAGVPEVPAPPARRAPVPAPRQNTLMMGMNAAELPKPGEPPPRRRMHTMDIAPGSPIGPGKNSVMPVAVPLPQKPASSSRSVPGARIHPSSSGAIPAPRSLAPPSPGLVPSPRATQAPRPPSSAGDVVAPANERKRTLYGTVPGTPAAAAARPAEPLPQQSPSSGVQPSERTSAAPRIPSAQLPAPGEPVIDPALLPPVLSGLLDDPFAGEDETTTSFGTLPNDTSKMAALVLPELPPESIDALVGDGDPDGRLDIDVALGEVDEPLTIPQSEAPTSGVAPVLGTVDLSGLQSMPSGSVTAPLPRPARDSVPPPRVSSPGSAGAPFPSLTTASPTGSISTSASSSGTRPSSAGLVPAPRRTPAERVVRAFGYALVIAGALTLLGVSARIVSRSFGRDPIGGWLDAISTTFTGSSLARPNTPPAQPVEIVDTRASQGGRLVAGPAEMETPLQGLAPALPPDPAPAPADVPAAAPAEVSAPAAPSEDLVPAPNVPPEIPSAPPPPEPAPPPPPDPVAPDVPEAPPEGEPISAAREQASQQLVDRARSLSTADAEPLLRRAMALDPRNHYAMIGLARSLLARGALHEAENFAEEAVRWRSRRAAYRVVLGNIRHALGNESAARQQWEEALRLEPDQHEARMRLGR